MFPCSFVFTNLLRATSMSRVTWSSAILASLWDMSVCIRDGHSLSRVGHSLTLWTLAYYLLPKIVFVFFAAWEHLTTRYFQHKNRSCDSYDMKLGLSPVLYPVVWLANLSTIHSIYRRNYRHQFILLRVADSSFFLSLFVLKHFIEFLNSTMKVSLVFLVPVAFWRLYSIPYAKEVGFLIPSNGWL